MQHAASLDLEDFEDSEVQDRLERARQQASGRTGLMSQLFNQAQDVVTIVSFGAGLFVYAPWLLALMAVALVPAFIGEVHFNAQTYWMNYMRAPERRESDYVRQTRMLPFAAKKATIEANYAANIPAVPRLSPAGARVALSESAGGPAWP